MRRILLAAAVCVCAFGARANGIPTASGVDHIGMTVPNLAQAIGFFRDVLGCQHVYTAGPFADPQGDWMHTNLGVDPRASTTLAMMRCGPTQNIELFEWNVVQQLQTPPLNSDVGGSHIAFYVTDMDKAVEYLKSVPGVHVLGAPTPVSGQPNGGETILYFDTPWGAHMEVLSYNHGLDYEKGTDQRLFSVQQGH